MEPGIEPDMNIVYRILNFVDRLPMLGEVTASALSADGEEDLVEDESESFDEALLWLFENGHTKCKYRINEIEYLTPSGHELLEDLREKGFGKMGASGDSTASK